MDQHQHELTVQEFNTLRAELLDCVSEVRKLEIYAVLSTAALYSFLLSVDKSPLGDTSLSYRVPLWAWGLPILFPLLSLMRGLAYYSQIMILAEYIKNIEAKYGRRPLGWEHHIGEARKKKRTKLGRSSRDFAYLLLAFTILVFAWRIVVFHFH